jgi:Protein of unknown function (DUF2970)
MNPSNHGQLKRAVQRPASVWQTVRTVAWSFFGVRRAADHEQDVQQLNPVHLVAAGLVLAAGFVMAVLFLVRWVVNSGVAA